MRKIITVLAAALLALLSVMAPPAFADETDAPATCHVLFEDGSWRECLSTDTGSTVPDDVCLFEDGSWGTCYPDVITDDGAPTAAPVTGPAAGVADEYNLPPCTFEDGSGQESTGCYWDAATRGNGQGTSVAYLPAESPLTVTTDADGTTTLSVPTAPTLPSTGGVTR